MERQLAQQNRRHILNYLEEVIFMATGDPVALRDHGDYIIIDHGHGTAQKACVECDSYLDMKMIAAAFEQVVARKGGEDHEG